MNIYNRFIHGRPGSILCVSVLVCLGMTSMLEAQPKKSGSKKKSKEQPQGAQRRVTVKVPFDEIIKSQTIDEQFKSLRRAVDDIEATFRERYDGETYLKKLVQLEQQADSADRTVALHKLQRKALLSNPALDFDDILLVRRYLGKKDRTTMGRDLGLTKGNSFSMQSSNRKSLGNEIAVVRDFKTKAVYETLYKPKKEILISDMDLHFSGEKILFTSLNDAGAFRLFEIGVDGRGFQQVTPDTEGGDVDHFDACYLPDGDIIFTSTATFYGMPCINGGPRMASIYRYSPKTKTIQQLSFDQDTSWCPTVLNNGRVAYLRWEYTDMVHSNNRILMSMNPDGTSQKSYMFSNSYFPAAFYYARPIPGDSSKVVGIATGHHGHSRSGRMLIVDPRLGVHEADGVVQEVPGYGKKVEAIVLDRLVDGIWPHFIHPFPVAENGTHKGGGNYFLVSMKPTADALWGIYLVDIYDNRTLIMEMDDYLLMEPIPLKSTAVPPQIPPLTNYSKDTATLYIQDVYSGPGLEGIPRGTIKSMRICSYEFSPSYSGGTGKSGGSGGIVGTLGVDGPWDIKRILGTVPVLEDGSVHLTIPASTPVFLQPLDEEGQALQLMRSWLVGLPGERVSCIGCHEDSTATPLPRRTLASGIVPSQIKPWKGAHINFDYASEIQPIVDLKCMGCHDAQPPAGRYTTTRPEYQNKPIPYLGPELIDDWAFRYSGSAGSNRGGGRFSKGYMELFVMTRGPGIESDMNILTPKEFSADTAELIQLLKKGHHGVELDPPEWSKLYEWIDLNTPYHGNRLNIVKGLSTEKAINTAFERSSDMIDLYGNAKTKFERFEDADTKTAITPILPNPVKEQKLRKQGTKPFSAKVRTRRKDPITFDLGNGLSIKLVYIPAGEFTMGSANGALDELPMHSQRIEKGFWMAETEITNAEFRQFDSAHSSKFEDRIGYQFGQLCYDVNGDELPAVRLSWQRAMDFCDWLAKKTGKKVTLPSEVQWEWACRSGTGTPFWYGDLDADFSEKENLADRQLEKFAEDTGGGSYKYYNMKMLVNPSRYEAYVPRINQVDDQSFLQQAPRKYEANPWGLYDMHGNIAEWTRSTFQPYPLKSHTDDVAGKRVVRGGSWRDRPYRSTSSYRLAYPEYQQVFNVGFRIIVEE